jgi:hypothetical protein
MNVEAKKYQKELDLEIVLKGLQEEELTDEEYLEEVRKIVKCNEEVDTEEVIGEKEVIVSNVDKDAVKYSLQLLHMLQRLKFREIKQE